MSIKDFIDTKQDEILSSQLVIACELTNTYAARLSELCKSKNIPLILLREYGMIGYMRVYKHESCIVEPKIIKKNVKDLRIESPWPELQDYVNSFDLPSLTEIEHIHVPFAIILIQAIQKWRSEHGGKAP